MISLYSYDSNEESEIEDSFFWKEGKEDWDLAFRSMPGDEYTGEVYENFFPSFDKNQSRGKVVNFPGFSNKIFDGFNEDFFFSILNKKLLGFSGSNGVFLHPHKNFLDVFNFWEFSFFRGGEDFGVFFSDDPLDSYFLEEDIYSLAGFWIIFGFLGLFFSFDYLAKRSFFLVNPSFFDNSSSFFLSKHFYLF